MGCEKDLAAADKPQKMVCIESVWCDIAHQIGGDFLEEDVILRSPSIEPHHFTPSPSVIRKMQNADILVLNGAHYDDWAENFQNKDQKIFNIARLNSWKEGEDPHLFFDFEAVERFSDALAALLIKESGDQKDYFLGNLKKLKVALSLLKEQHKKIIPMTQNEKIAVIEPAGMRLLEKLNFKIINKNWAFDMMNDQNVSPRETAFLEEEIEKKSIRFLVINPLIKGDLSDHIVHLAEKSQIKFLFIGETLPPHKNWQEWIEDIYSHISILETVHEK